MYGLKKRSKQDESGQIQGAGTGTSDDIKKTVPSGSYIMPADSTQKIGTDNLKNMGSPTPVNLSNGEFQLSPDQVHSVGVHTLDAMKDQTHVPVPDQNGFGFNPRLTKANGKQKEQTQFGFKPEMFFANGGVVPDLLKRREQNQNPMMNKGMGEALNNGFGKTPSLGSPQKTQEEKYIPQSFTESVVDDIGSNVGNEWKHGNYARGMGQGVRGILSLPGAAAYDAFQPVGNFFGGLFNTDSSTTKNSNTQPIATKQPDPPKVVDVTANNTAQTVDKKPTTTTPPPVTNIDKPTVNTTTQAQPKVDMFDLKQATTNQVQTQPNPFAIQQKGNAFSYTNPVAAAQARANGVQEGEGLGFRVRPANDPKGVANFMQNTREMGPTQGQVQDAIAQREMNIGMQGYGNIARQPQAPQRSPEQEAERQQIMNELRTPYRGSQNGQLTARQFDNIVRMQTGDDDRAQQRYVTDANNAATLQREAMGQAGQNYRTELGEQGVNNRFDSNLNLEAQKFNATNDLANRQFSEEQLNNMPTRMKQAYELNLLKQYEAAQTPEERQSLTERLGMVRGQSKQQAGNPYMQIKQGEVVNEKGVVTQPSKEYLYNTQTGQTVDPLASIRSQVQIPQAAIDALKSDPKRAVEFDSKYGQGSSAQYLNG